jgi:hypothetical protein
VGDEEKAVANIGDANFQRLTKRFKEGHVAILGFYPLRPVTIGLSALTWALTNRFELL